MAQRSLLACEAFEALVQENQRIWETPRPLYEPWKTWRLWLDEYRELVRDVHNMSRTATCEAEEQSKHTP